MDLLLIYIIRTLHKIEFRFKTFKALDFLYIENNIFQIIISLFPTNDKVILRDLNR